MQQLAASLDLGAIQVLNLTNMVPSESGNSPSENSAGSFHILSRQAIIDFFVITALWVFAIVIVRPVGEFPLNDDWSWGMTAKRLAQGNGYQPGAWSEMTLFSHALWGALFCLPFGFSFTALRFSTLALSLVGALSFYALIRQLQRPRLLAVLCALTLVFSPIFFALSNTFMADVPFTAWATLSMLFFVRNFQHGTTSSLILATTFAVVATLSRQMGLSIPFAFAITLCLKQGFQRRELLRAFLPALICFLCLMAFQYWQKTTNGPPPNNMRTERLWSVLSNPIKIPINLAYYGWGMLMYLGWFLLPITLPAILNRRNVDPKGPPCFPARIALFMFFSVSVARFLFVPTLMPVHNNVIIPQGIGPVTLRDVFDFHLPHLPAWPSLFWILVTVLSLGGAALLIFELVKIVIHFFPKGRLRRINATEQVAVFFLLGAAIYLLPFLLSGYFDRYLLPVVVSAIALLATALDWSGFDKLRFKHLGSIVLIMAAGFFSVVATRDYLEWNRTRWKTLDELVAQKKIPASDIDGGFEFNGWNSFDHLFQTNGSAFSYIVSFGEIEGCENVSTNTYRNWMPPHEGRILVLKRRTEN